MQGDSTSSLLAVIHSNRLHVQKYEDSDFQQKALQCVPLSRLKTAALEKGTSGGLTFHEHFIKQVMHWFKKEYFRWVDCKRCAACGAESRNAGVLPPNPQELAAGGSRVESHACTVCGAIQRFPRYNCPKKLLETREGRCGEWANCFTGICRALGYDARYVYDVTDHVWSEVYSVHLDRWVHLDPCENAWDRPLIYEQGWKKQLSYVIASSKDEVVDVTYRYVLDAGIARARREGESAVISKIASLNKMFSHSPAKRQALSGRLAREIAALLAKASPVNEVYGGRESGSISWRKDRGEAGDRENSSSSGIDRGMIKTDGASSSFTVEYSPVSDSYTVVKDGGSVERVPGFGSLAGLHSGIVRKIEYDWNMVYLARETGHSQSFIEWEVECKKPISSVHLTLSSTTFHGGRISWSYESRDVTTPLPSPSGHDSTESTRVELAGVQGERGFKVSVRMWSEKEEENSWQHTQVFRTGLDSEETVFKIEILF